MPRDNGSELPPKLSKISFAQGCFSKIARAFRTTPLNLSVATLHFLAFSCSSARRLLVCIASWRRETRASIDLFFSAICSQKTFAEFVSIGGLSPRGVSTRAFLLRLKKLVAWFGNVGCRSGTMLFGVGGACTPGVVGCGNPAAFGAFAEITDTEI